MLLSEENEVQDELRTLHGNKNETVCVSGKNYTLVWEYEG